MAFTVVLKAINEMDDEMRCNWCGEEIRVGETYQFRDEKSGRLYYHPGCFNHAAKY